MRQSLKAVIFDMDGVIIDSEPLWRQAMMKGFSRNGMNLTEEDCRKTMGLRFHEVIQHWLRFYTISHVDPLKLEQEVMKLLLELIDTEGILIHGIAEILAFCKEKKLKMGLATSSSNLLMAAVLKKLNLTTSLDVAVSAEHMQYGKPHPEVFLNCAEKLKVNPKECIVIEDSLNGVIAGKAAQMLVIAVPEDKFQKTDKFIVADYTRNSMPEVLDLFKTLFERQSDNK